MTLLELKFLGELSIHQDGVPLTALKSQKGQALLCYLALTGRAYTRSALAGLFWPEMPEAGALMNLRKVLNRLNPHLAPYLTITWQTVAFNQDSAYRLDAAEFEAGAAAKEDIGRLQAAIALYQGDFLEGFTLPDAPQFEEWVLAQRARLREMALSALQMLITHFATRTEYEAAIAYTRQLLDIEPWREEGHQELMRLLALSGQRSAALMQYETCRRILAEELDVEPAPATVNVYEQIRQNQVELVVLAGGESLARTTVAEALPTAARIQPIAHNLPVQSMSLIGRVAELAALDDLITRPDGRLVTIVGPGGIGKTRLAMACAESCLGAPDLFANGVFFVNLAPLSDVDQIIPTLAQSLRFPLQPDDPHSPRQQVLDYLSRKRMLLVMDNFEHLLDGVDLLVEMAQSAPDVRILATSRERLHLQLEQVYPLQGLPFPETTTAPSSEIAEDVLAYPAIQLFRQCARRNLPDFDLHAAVNVADLAHICRLVAGMPLAIILASAWLELLTPEEIAAEIQKNVDFLEADYQDLPGRQRSMRAVFDTSWNQLNEAEQKTLAALSVFQGGFTLKAALEVAGASARTMLRLVGRSLVNRDENGRFDIHELLRQFAADKLNMLIDWKTAVHSNHSVYYCTLLQNHTADWYNARQLEALTEVTLEEGNIQRAWHWALLRGEFNRLTHSIHSWARFHEWQGRHEEGKTICDTIIEQAESQSNESTASPDSLRLWAMALTWLSRFTYDDSIALLKLEQSMAILERLESAGYDVPEEKAFLFFRRSASLLTLNLLEARQSAEQSLHLYRKLGNQMGIGHSLANLNHIDFQTGALDLHADKGQAVLDIFIKMGDLRGQMLHMAQQGIFHKVLGQFERAEQLERDVISRSRQLGNPTNIFLANLAYTLFWQGKFDEAHQPAKESLEICRDLGHLHHEDWTLYYLSQILLHEGKYQSSRQQLANGLIIAKSVGDPAIEAALYGTLGQLALIALDNDEAQASFTKSAELFRESPNSFIDFSKAGLGYLAIYLNQLEKARRYLIDGITTALSIKNYQQNLFALPGVALLLVKMGVSIRALEIWTLAKTQPLVAQSIWFEEIVGRIIDKEAANLPSETAAAAQERGRKLDLWQTADSLLQELEELI